MISRVRAAEPTGAGSSAACGIAAGRVGIRVLGGRARPAGLFNRSKCRNRYDRRQRGNRLRLVDISLPLHDEGMPRAHRPRGAAGRLPSETARA
jgi:hypothetical protein